MESAKDNSGESRKPKGSPPPSTAELDELISGYKFVEYLDSGGMGAVYKAVQKSLNRTVAVKLLPKVHLDKEGFADRFKREAHALAQLSHPHIISVYDSGETRDGQLYYVMEFVSGMDLQHLLKRESPSPRRILQIISQVCDALQYAHERGIVHRDVKPANILIDERGNVKVADFGLAKIVGPEAVDYTATGTTLGTPDYIAPEAMEYGVKIDHRVDIYSLGVMIYEILTGHVPKGQWEPPSIRSGADKRIDALVSRAMQNDPDKRYQQVSDMTQVLGKLLKNCDNWKNYRRPSKISAIMPPGGGRAASTGAVTQKFGQHPGISARPMVRTALLTALVILIGVAAAWQAGWLPGGSGVAEAAGANSPVPAEPPMPAATTEGEAAAPEQLQLAVWVLEHGGILNVLTPENMWELEGPDVPVTWPPPLVQVPKAGALLAGNSDVRFMSDLPQGRFHVWRVAFLGIPLMEAAFAELVDLIAAADTVSHLNLRGLDVPTTALEKLAGLPSLRSLDLRLSPAVTPAAMPYLGACKQLGLLRLGGGESHVTESMLEELRSLLTGCGVHDDP